MQREPEKKHFCQYCGVELTFGRVCSECSKKRKALREIRRILAPFIQQKEEDKNRGE